jgi:hypothetical protein
MAKDRTGVAVALVMQTGEDDRIWVVRLDAATHDFAGPAHSIPAASADTVEVMSPSLAPLPGGDGFTLAWLETPPGQSVLARPAFCRLDKNLNPSSPPTLLPLPDRGAVTSPAIVRSGKTTWIAADRSVWQIRADGSINGPLDPGVAASDMTIVADSPQLISNDVVKIKTNACGPGPSCISGDFERNCLCPVFRSEYVLEFVSLFNLSASYTFDFDSHASPAIGGDGHDLLAAWFNGNPAFGNSVVATRFPLSSSVDFAHAASDFRIIGNFGVDGGPTRPDIAADADRYVVVWRTTTAAGDHDISGASIDHAGNVISFPISNTAADERDPSVIAVSNGTFFVAYEKLSGGGRSIVGKFLTFPPLPHRNRAVRY